MKIVEHGDEPVYPNFFLVGPPKSGKSTAAASAPPPVLFLNLDSPNSLAYARKKHPNIIEVEFEGLPTMTEIAHAVYEPPGKRIAETVVIDPLGGLHKRLIDFISNRALNPTLPQYGAASTHIERFLDHLCKAPVNLVVVAHDTAVKDEATGEMVRLPRMGTSNPELGLKMSEWADVLAYCGVGKDAEGNLRPMAQLFNGNGRRGGDRFDVLAEEGGFAPLDVGEWIQKIRAEFGPAQQEEKKAA